jgi:hypothetical protein
MYFLHCSALKEARQGFGSHVAGTSRKSSWSWRNVRWCVLTAISAQYQVIGYLIE